MNTKTMRLPPRRVLTTNKRKERDDPWPKPIISSKLHKPEKPTPRPSYEPIKSSSVSSGGGKAVMQPVPSNHLLAGYLAHEFLTKGTLMGHPWAPPGVESGEKLKCKEEMGSREGGAAAAETPCRKLAENVKERYAEVAALLKGGKSHLPGVVNPTHLVSFLH